MLPSHWDVETREFAIEQANVDILNLALSNRPQHEARGNKPHKNCTLFPGASC